MKRFEISISTPDKFELDDESIDNIKRYLCWCFKVGDIHIDAWSLPDWTTRWALQEAGIDPEIPF